ncbi:hypothetical protein V2K91_05935 [Pseudomonas alliivorans]|nr:hypothetical protein [Pseudomonas alliivorans]
MTRNDHDEIETMAIAVMIGLLSAGSVPKADVPSHAFDIAEAFQKEKQKRIGEKPPFDH